MSQRQLRIQNATEHNLQGVDLTIPRESLVTFTGVSGSGKSSLVFDTIFQEGQRRFLESLSAYARQFVGRMHRPQAEHISGLSPTVAIDQKTTGRSRRSTVGTITGLMDLLRLFMARLGQPHCPVCHTPISSLAPGRIVELILESARARTAAGADRPPLLLVLAPVVDGRKGEHRALLDGLRLKGFIRARIDGEIRRLDEEFRLARYKVHTIEVVTDRLRPGAATASRLAEAVETALVHGEQTVAALWEDGTVERFNALASCPQGHGALPEMEPRLFSFNSPHGACPACQGLGLVDRFTEHSLVGDDRLSLLEGALRCTTGYGSLGCRGLRPEDFEVVATFHGFDLEVPWRELNARHRKTILHGGTGDERKLGRPFLGVVPWLERCWKRGKNLSLKRLMESSECLACGGGRLRPEALAVTFEERSIADLAALTVAEAREYFAGLQLGGAREEIGRDLLREIRSRLDFLVQVGVPYLQLDRRANTLSGGEAQRLRIAGQLGSGLCGVTYVLDEPSVGLHARDQERLVGALTRLRDRGNTVLVVEHDDATMRASDLLVDIGPGPGYAGGRIVAQGTPAALARRADSPTGRVLGGRERMDDPPRRPPGAPALVLTAPTLNNLKGMAVTVPLERFVTVSGVSGSGKSSLIQGTLRPLLERQLTEGQVRGLKRQGGAAVDKLLVIDAAPIGRTPRSNPATYTGAFTPIRELFARTADARMRGYTKSRFSFNLPGGRCEACGGAGVQQLEMHFLPPVEVPCETCEGQRFNRETLEIRYKGRTILDVLEMEVAQALEFFDPIPKVRRPLQALVDVGLGYLRLGQTATTLSGGEAQRVKLAAELAAPRTDHTLYLFDEPTTGLHFTDVRTLLRALNRLVEAGNSVVVIEHNLDVIWYADWVLDLGPEGGEGGGELVCAGPPEALLECAESRTGHALAQRREKAPRSPRRGRRARRGEGRCLTVRGARKNNLQSVDLDLPLEKLIVITGLSGSGKTSLAFDTLFNEGQRRFVESLTTYARRFLGRLEPAPVDRIEGIGPAIAVGRGAPSRNPRSTVATATEVHDYLRLLYARVGQAVCPEHGLPMVTWTPGAMARHAVECHPDQAAWITAPWGTLDGAGLEAHRQEWAAAGFARCLVEGEECRLDRGPLDRSGRVDLVCDRVRLLPRNRSRIAEAAEQAAEMGDGRVTIRTREGESLEFTVSRSCARCGFRLPQQLNPRFFSFNHHEGACPVCHGLGVVPACNPDALITDPSQPLFDGALGHRGLRRLLWRRGSTARHLLREARARRVDLDLPVAELAGRDRRWLLHGGGPASGARRRAWPGLAAVVDSHLAERGSAEEGGESELTELLSEAPCTACDGGRLNPAAAAVTVGGLTLPALVALGAGEALERIEGWQLSATERAVVGEVLTEIVGRLRFLVDVGVGYLGLDRPMRTLSGGEAQRIRLATQLGSRLAGVLYVLDEPTVGLHPRDTARLTATLTELRDLGNTVVVVEHDEELIRAADHLVDLGPGAGRQGGRVVASGAPAAVAADPASVTGRWLRGESTLPVSRSRRPGTGSSLRIEKARTHNLQGVDVDLPLGTLTAVTGVSGAGKSSLIMETLLPALRGEKVAATVTGGEAVSRLQVVDARPIGRSPGSNPATFTGVFTHIRELFAATEIARMKGYTARRFSPNVTGGRCEECKGRGWQRIEMHFLPDVWLECDLCGGRRFNRETLQVVYNGHTIAEVLDMEVAQALDLFRSHRKIYETLSLLSDVGLGYLRLGQGAHTLSGGEAQRLRLAAELAGPGGAGNLYILDEPTTGLHLEDIERLLQVLHRLVDRGGTVLLVEHHPGVVASADWVIDLGPEAADGGGRVVVAGPPERVAACAGSRTGEVLAGILADGRQRVRKGG